MHPAEFLGLSTVSIEIFYRDQVVWRRGRDSNPRYAINVYTLSRRAPSTTRPPLRIPDYLQAACTEACCAADAKGIQKWALPQLRRGGFRVNFGKIFAGTFFWCFRGVISNPVHLWRYRRLLPIHQWSHLSSSGR